MKDLEKIISECISELKAIGIVCPEISYSVNTRAKKRWGQCKRLENGDYDLYLRISDSDGKYAIRLANDDIWNESLKANKIGGFSHWD